MEIFASFDVELGAKLIESVGTREFGPNLLRAAKGVSQIDELYGYVVVDGEEPKTIVTASFLRGAERRVAAYVERFYQHDPAVREFRSIAAGKSFVLRIPLTNIIAHDYRRICFKRPGFAEKLSFGWRGKDYMLVLSFYRRNPGDRQELEKLSSLVTLIMPVMVRHHAPIDRENAVTVLERRMQRSYPALTQRERQVCARTIMGQSAEAIATEVGLSRGTILTYRQRAYQKADVSAAGELVARLLN